jgi:uncharacterized protein YrrD
MASEIYRHTASRVVSSFVPIDSIPIKDAVYDCVYNKSSDIVKACDIVKGDFIKPHEFVKASNFVKASDFAKHLVIQAVSYEVTQGVHAVVNKIASSL